MFLKKRNQFINFQKNSSLKYDKKWDHINFEHTLEIKRKSLDEKIKDFKFETKRLFLILSTTKKDKEEMEYNKDILENYSKYNIEEDKILKKISYVEKRIDKLNDFEFERVTNFKKLIDV